MSRILTIARREYLAYAKTVGFWLSLLSLPLFGLIGGGVVYMIKSSEPIRAVAVVEQGEDAAGLRAVIAGQIARNHPSPIPIPASPGMPAPAARAEAPEKGSGRSLVRLVNTPPEIAQAATLQAQVVAARLFLGDDAPEGRALDAVVFARQTPTGPTAQVWTRRTTDGAVESVVEQALVTANRRQVFENAGIDPGVVVSTESYRPSIRSFSPRAADGGGEVGMRDRLPVIVGLATGFLLWSLVITGASILMNSVMEEKANKILEVLLSSASATEILAGKVLGVALVTLTMLAGWGIMAVAALSSFAPEVLPMIGEVLTHGGLILYFLAYMIGGYLMYAVLFAAVGAFCETPRDAQTLMGPIMMVLMIPLFVMQLALQTPDAPVVRILSWIPFFTPFLMSARAPTEPPVLEIILTMVGMFAFAALMVWAAGRAFRAGALSDVKLNWLSFARAVRGGGN